MASNILKARTIQKCDTEENWEKATNFIPMKGEMCIYLADDSHSFPRFKVGDGETLINALPFSSVEPIKTTEIDEVCVSN